VEHEEKRLDDSQDADYFPGAALDGWRKGSVYIHLPKEKVKYGSEEDAPKFEVKGLIYRPLIEVVKAAYEDPSVRSFHHIPFKLFHQKDNSTGTLLLEPYKLHSADFYPSSINAESPNNHLASEETSSMPADAERIYTEVYTSDAMLEEDAKIRAMPRNPADSVQIEYIMAAMLFWSDATHLASFGTASLWPIYCLFAGVSKYLRVSPNTYSAHHLAYLPSVRAQFILFNIL
jgi:hypothetical protein